MIIKIFILEKLPNIPYNDIIQTGGFFMDENKYDMPNLTNNMTDETGKVLITDDVVAVVAGVAAMEVPGVAGMSGGIVGDVAEILGRRNLTKGVKVEVGEIEAAIDLYVIIEYGYRIPEVSWKMQETVKEAVESMTGLSVVEVNIHVQGVSVIKDVLDKEEDNTNHKKARVK